MDTKEKQAFSPQKPRKDSEISPEDEKMLDEAARTIADISHQKGWSIERTKGEAIAEAITLKVTRKKKKK
jgi:hypothetical protein